MKPDFHFARSSLADEMAEAKRDEGATDCGLSLPAATEQERDLAQAATNAFERADFDACLSTLSKLAVTRANDPKLMLNRAVAEYYRGGFVRTDALRKVLAEVCVKVHPSPRPNTPRCADRKENTHPHRNPLGRQEGVSSRAQHEGNSWI